MALSSTQILNQYRGRQRHENGDFYDADGDSSTGCDACDSCLFHYGDVCAPLKERGLSDLDMRRRQIEVFDKRNCPFLLSYGFDSADDAKRDIAKLNRVLFGSSSRSNVDARAAKAGASWFKIIFITVAIAILYVVLKK